MLRSSCLTCCAALVLYLSPRLDCMTVSPITYFTTASNRYPETAKSHYGSNGSPSSYAAYGYGHRTMPAYGAAKARRSHDEQRHGHAQPYETPNTYEYMSNPSRKTSEASRVPGTERRPPAGDVELIGDGPRKEQHHRRVKKRRKKIRKQARPDGDDYRDGDGRAAEPDVGSSSKKHVQRSSGGGGGGAVSAVHKNERAASEGEKRTPPLQQRAKNNDGPHRDKEEIDEEYAALDARTKHKIHKKNEYSKRQQFFDEEHVDNGNKRPAASAAQDGRGKKVHVKGRGDVQRAGAKRKRRAKKDHDVKKRVQQNHGHGGGTRLQLHQGSSQGYGQVLAVR